MGNDDTGLVAVAERAAAAGGRYARRAFRRPLDVEYKRDAMDAVTAVDREAQRRVLGVLHRGSPVGTAVAEELDARKRVPREGPAWVVDPIDGTNNFVRGNRVWATAVALVRDREPRLGVTTLPAMGDTYVAAGETVTRNGRAIDVSERSAPEAFTVAPVFGLKLDDMEAYLRVSRVIVERFGDLRRFGSAQAALAMVAAGELDAAVATTRLAAWDTVAGVELVRTAGGRVTDLQGEPWAVDSDGLVASNGRCHAALTAALREGLAARTE